MSYQLKAGSNVSLTVNGDDLEVSAKGIDTIYEGDRVCAYQFNSQVNNQEYKRFDIVLTYGGESRTTVTVYPDSNARLRVPVQYMGIDYEGSKYTLFMCHVDIDGSGITVSNTLVYDSTAGSYTQAGQLLGISAIYGVKK